MRKSEFSNWASLIHFFTCSLIHLNENGNFNFYCSLRLTRVRVGFSWGNKAAHWLSRTLRLYSAKYLQLPNQAPLYCVVSEQKKKLKAMLKRQCRRHSCIHFSPAFLSCKLLFYIFCESTANDKMYSKNGNCRVSVHYSF